MCACNVSDGKFILGENLSCLVYDEAKPICAWLNQCCHRIQVEAKFHESKEKLGKARPKVALSVGDCWWQILIMFWFHLFWACPNSGIKTNQAIILLGTTEYCCGTFTLTKHVLDKREATLEFDKYYIFCVDQIKADIMKKETTSKWALPVVYVWSKHLTLYSITSFLIFWLWNLFCLFQKMEKFGSLSLWK